MPYLLIAADGAASLLPNSTTRSQMGERWDGALGRLYSPDSTSADRLYAYCDDIFLSREVQPDVNEAASELFDETIRGDVILHGGFDDDADREKPLSEGQWARLAVFFANLV